MHYKALIINCMDPRLQGDNEIKIAGAAGFKPSEYEVLTYAGPSLWMTDPHEKNHVDSFWWLLKNVSLDVHHINSIVIVGHSQCGGFALKDAPKEPSAEKQTITNSLKAAGKIIKDNYPSLEIKLVFVNIEQATTNTLPAIDIDAIGGY